MNIFHKIALEGLRRNRTRTFVTVMGVILSATLVTAIATFAVSLQEYMINGAIVKNGNWHVELPDADAALLSRVGLDERVADTVSLENLGYAFLDGGQNPDKPYLFVSGWDQKAFDTLPISLLSGRLPENATEVVLPAHVASNGGVKISVGDTLTLPVGYRQAGGEVLGQHDPYRSGEETLVLAGQMTCTVVGICGRPVEEEYTAPGYTLITRVDGMDQAGEEGFGFKTDTAAFTVFVALKNPWQVGSYIRELSVMQESGSPDDRDGVGYVLNDNVLRFMGLSGNTAFTVLLYTAGAILTVLVMVGSVFLIYNSFQISLNERTRQFGVLMSVGATARQLRGTVLFEGLCIGALGIPLGVCLGILGVRLVLMLVEHNFQNVLYHNVPLTLRVSLPVLVGAVVVSMVTILLSAHIPSRKAAAIPVMVCIRQTDAVKVGQKDVRVPRFAERFYDLEKILARKNFGRNRRRYRSIVLSLSLSVILFVSADAFRNCLNQVAGQTVADVGGDIYFTSQDMEEEDVEQLYDSLKKADGVTGSTWYPFRTCFCAVGTQEPALTMGIWFLSEEAYVAYLEDCSLPVEEYTGSDAKIVVARNALEGESLVGNQFASLTVSSVDEGNGPGENPGRMEKIRATFVEHIPIVFQAAGITGKQEYQLLAFAPMQQKTRFDDLVGTAGACLVFCTGNPGQTESGMCQIIQSMGVTAQYTLRNVHASLEENRNMMFIVNLFSGVFIIMVSLIAVANVFNTISTNVMMRRRELAMLRSVGMADRDFNRMMRFECILYGSRTMLLGLPVSAVLSWLIYRGMDMGGADFPEAFRLPWRSMGISALGVFLVIIVTMFYTTGKIRKENIMDALREDT